MFVKYIQAETGARVQIKGRGSGFIENDTGREADDEMHISIVAPTDDQIQRAKNLAEDLLMVLRIEYEKARSGGRGGGGGGGGGAGGSGLGGAPSRMASLTPARTPAPNELEYLDVFNWFNYPRVPPGGENALYPMAHGMVDAAAAGGGLAGGTAANGSGGDGHGGVIPVTAEYINFGTYAVDATRDWLGV